jgi:membrane protease YdiL (CAAX protease family)
VSASSFAQLAAIARMLATSTLNAIRRRQGAGALLVLPLAGTFLVIELARFGGRSAHGMARVLARVPPARGVHYASFWLLVLFVALTGLKYARVVPGRGSRKLFDTPLVRALPVAPFARAGFDLLAASTYGVGLTALVMVPTLWGLCRHVRDGSVSFAITALGMFVANTVATLIAVALHEGWSRRLSGRVLDGVRVATAVVSLGALGMFTAIGPLGAGLARTLRTGTKVPWWSEFLPTRPLVRWILGDASDAAPWRVLALVLVPVLVAVGVLAWRARHATDLALDGPWKPFDAHRWEGGLTVWRAELRAMLRQGPYLPLAAPAFLVFFFLLGKGARSATGADLPLLTLMGLCAWAVVVMGVALTGAASRRWRRVLTLPTAQGAGHRATVRGVALANFVLTAPIAFGPLVVLLRGQQPEAIWYVRMVVGVLVAIGVGQWMQSAALFVLIDPAPDRLTGLSVGAVFWVLVATLPAAGLVVLLSAVPLLSWCAGLALVALIAWSLERTAIERLRWIVDPEGDPEAPARSWPALAAFATALLAQVVVMEFCASVVHSSFALGVLAGYGIFALAIAPRAWRAWRREAPVPRWSRLRAVAVGVLLGALSFALTVAVMRALRGAAHGSASAQAIASASGAVRWALAVVASVLAPVTEEMFFRGWLQHALARDLPEGKARWAFVLTAAVFAVMHSGEPWGPVFVSGLLAGALMDRARRLEAPLAFHVTANAFGVLVALAG